MFEEIERLTRALCAEHGTSGCEGDVFKVAKKELGFCKEVCENELGGVVGIFGDLSSKRRILLDAHKIHRTSCRWTEWTGTRKTRPPAQSR